MKRFFLFAIFLFAAGCHIPTVPSPDMLTIVETAFDPAVFAQGRKAAVIIEATNDLPSEDPMLNNLTFKNRRTGELFYVSTTGREVLMISPGEYDLVKFVISGSTGLTFSEADLTPRYRASFSVKAGDVAYLGRVKTHVVMGKKEYDNFGPATQRVRSHTFLLNGIDSLPADFIGRIERLTGKKPTSNLIEWRKNASAGYSR